MLGPLGHLFQALAPALVLLVAPPRLLLLQHVESALAGVLQLWVRQQLLRDGLLALLLCQPAYRMNRIIVGSALATVYEDVNSLRMSLVI